MYNSGLETQMEKNYQIRAKIASGTLGELFQAYDVLNYRNVILKRVSLEKFREPEAVVDFFRTKFEMIAQIRHANLVSIYDCGLDENGPFVVMEAVEGLTLNQMVSQGNFGMEDFAKFAQQVMAGMAALHARQVLHLCLKPEHVLVEKSGAGMYVKILDASLGTLYPYLEADADEWNRYNFRAPEQLEQGVVDVRADLYSMGCLFYYVLTGCHLYSGSTREKLRESYLAQKFETVAALRPDLPSWVSSWLHQLLSRDPKQRPDSVEIVQKMFALHHEEEVQPEPAPSVAAPVKVIPAPAPTSRIPRAVPAPAPTSRIPRPAVIPAPAPTSRIARSAPVPAVVAVPAPAPTARIARPNGTVGVVPVPPPVRTSRMVNPNAGARPVPAAVAVPAKNVVAAAASAATPPAIPSSEPAVVNTPPRLPSKPVKKGGWKPVYTLICSVAAVAIFVGVVMLKRAKAEDEQIAYLALIQKGLTAKEPIPLKKSQVKAYLADMATSPMKEAQDIGALLRMATSKDGEDLDARYVDFALDQSISRDSRVIMLEQVIGRRPVVMESVQRLTAFVAKTSDEKIAAAVLAGLRDTATDQQFDSVVGVLVTTNVPAIRAQAQNVVKGILSRSKEKASLLQMLDTASVNADDSVRGFLLELRDTYRGL